MILVTGGAGFIGSHLVDFLISAGHRVRVIDNESALENEKFYWNPRAENYNLDAGNYEVTRKLYDGVHTVYHLAAISRIQPAIENPGGAITSNVIGMSNVLQCSAEAGVERFVFSSSSSIYGNNPTPNIETQQPDCLTIYSSTKLIGEQLCKVFNEAYGLETIALRFFNVYGDRQPIAGKYATVIGKFQKQKHLGQPLTVVGDGTQSRSFTHVSDVVSALYLAGTSKVAKESFGQVYNAGIEESYSIINVAHMISNNTINVPQRPGEARSSFSNSSKFIQAFGWDPQIYLDDWLKANE